MEKRLAAACQMLSVIMLLDNLHSPMYLTTSAFHLAVE